MPQPFQPLDERPGRARPQPQRLTLRRKFAHAACATLMFVGVFELALRVSGFRFLSRTPQVVVDGEAVAPMFRHSRSIRWEPIAGAGPFNADGFVGPLIPIERVAGTFRVATLGDSCTQFGDPPYAELLARTLPSRLGQPVEVLNAGVGGYSTEQGLHRLRQRVMAYRPDIVTIYFGWNDHWIMERLTDAEIAAEESRSWRWLDLTGGSRIVQLGLYGAHAVHERNAWRLRQQSLVPRVPLNRYRRNLTEMVELVREHKARPILVTAPTDMTDETGQYEFSNLHGLAGFETPRALHEAYVAATRKVSVDAGTPLVDAAAHFANRTRLMTRDHIHLTAAGIEQIAELLADEIVRINEQLGRNASADLPRP